MNRGRIWHEQWVSCGICEDQQALASTTHPEALKEAKRQEWHRTKEHGWICCHCWERRKTVTNA